MVYESGVDINGHSSNDSDPIWLVVTGTWLDYDFPFTWEESSQLTNSYFSEGLKPNGHSSNDSVPMG